MPPQDSMSWMMLFTLLLAGVGDCARDGDNWTSLAIYPQYGALPDCAQDCLYNAYTVAKCTSYGCVCSAGPGGTNYFNDFSWVSTCADRNCSDISGAATIAGNAFRDICAQALGLANDTDILTPPTSSAPPSSVSTAAGTSTAAIPVPTYVMQIKPHTGRVPYEDLPPCSKAALNGCRRANGLRQEDDCYIINTVHADAWDAYYGVAAQTQCESVPCICNSSLFFTAGQNLMDAGTLLCNYVQSPKDKVQPDTDELLAALATFCLENGVPAPDYITRLVGNRDSSLANTHSNGLDGATIASLAIGAAALAVAIATLVVNLRSYRIDKERRVQHGVATRSSIKGKAPVTRPPPPNRPVPVARREPVVTAPAGSGPAR